MRIVPSIIRVNVGENVELYCESSKYHIWFFRFTIKDPISRDNPLTLVSVNSSMTGNYFCLGTYEDKETNFLAYSNIKVYGKVFIFIDILFLLIII